MPEAVGALVVTAKHQEQGALVVVVVVVQERAVEMEPQEQSIRAVVAVVLLGIVLELVVMVAAEKS
jgi:hypothetical protein